MGCFVLIGALAAACGLLYRRIRRCERRLLTQRARLDVMETHLNAHGDVLHVLARRARGRVIYEAEAN